MESLGAGDLSRALALAALALCAPPTRAAQATAAPPPTPRELDQAAWEQHRACVISERLQSFVAHYLRASEEARAGAAAALAAEQPKAAPGWAPGIDALRRVESRIADASGRAPDDAALAALDALAGALDLVIVPGAFEATSEGVGDPMTVRVRRLHTLDVGEDFVLSLRWLAPDGSELPARREPVSAAALSAEGFEMYVRAPLTGPGPWRLYGVVGRPSSGELAGALASVRVDAVLDLRARARAALDKQLPNQPGLHHLKVALDRLLRSGRRLSASLAAGDLLRAIEGYGDSGPPTRMPVPLEQVFVDARGVERWLWTYGPAEEPLRALAVLAQSMEPSDHVFAGALGREWLEFAERTRTQLFALHLPNDAARAKETLERLRSWVDDRELYVVARGEATQRLERGVAGLERAALAGLVVCSPVALLADSAALQPFPRLLVGPADDRAKLSAGATALPASGALLLDDLALPRQVEQWLATLAVPNGQGK